MPTAPDSTNQSYFRRIATISGAIAIGVLVWLYLAKPTSPPSQPANQNLFEPVAATPQQFTDVIGRVNGVKDSTITLRTTITSQDGQRRAHDYQIAVAETTALTTVRISGTEVQPEALTLAGIEPNDTLHVYADENLYQTETFTAIRIVKLINQ